MFCPKCGNELPDSAAFCNKCGNKVTKRENPQPAATPAQPSSSSPQFTSTTPMAAPVVQGGFSVMAIVRIILGIALILLIFLPWVSESLTSSYAVSFSLVDLWSMRILDTTGTISWTFPGYIIGAGLLILGALLELVTRISALKWLSLAGAVISLATVAAMLLFTLGSSSYGFPIVPIVAVVLALVSIATCAVKK